MHSLPSILAGTSRTGVLATATVQAPHDKHIEERSSLYAALSQPLPSEIGSWQSATRLSLGFASSDCLTRLFPVPKGHTCLQEPQGKLPRVNATIDAPLGMHDPENSPLCTAFREPGVKAVAIVGNGPLNDAQRKEINTFDVVVR